MAWKPKVERVFHEFVFERKTLRMPVEEFERRWGKEGMGKEGMGKEGMGKEGTPNAASTTPSLLDSKKPTVPTCSGLRRRLKHLSQERQFITYDSSFSIAMNAMEKTGQIAIVTPVGRERSGKKGFGDVELPKSEESYSVIHKRRVSLRKEQEWADIKVAQALAISKARARSPAAKDAEVLSKSFSGKGRPTHISTYSICGNDTTKAFQASFLRTKAPHLPH